MSGMKGHTKIDRRYMDRFNLGKKLLSGKFCQWRHIVCDYTMSKRKPPHPSMDILVFWRKINWWGHAHDFTIHLYIYLIFNIELK